MLSTTKKHRQSVRLFLGLVVVGFVGALASGLVLAADPSHIVPILFAEVSLIFLSAILIERALLAEFNEDAAKRAERMAEEASARTRKMSEDAADQARQMTSEITAGIHAYFTSEFSVLRFAEQYALSLLPPRRSYRNKNVTYSRIAEAIRRSKRVCFFCTSGVDLFPQTNTPSELFSALTARAADESRSLYLTVLSCDPDGEYAKVRGRVENAKRPMYIKRDVGLAYDSFLQLIQACKNSELVAEWYMYDFAPQMWFLMTDVEVFVEPYHFGLERRAPGEATSCIGGRVPIIRARASSGLYKALDEYVAFLTLPNEDSDLERIRTEYFKIKRVERPGGDAA